MMKKLWKYRCLCVMAVATIAAHSAVANSSKEYWGSLIASANSHNYSNAETVYGLAWNYPSASEAVKAAIGVCERRGGVHCRTVDRLILTFSTSSPRHDAESLDSSASPSYRLSRARCIAIGVGRDGFEAYAYTGNSEKYAQARLEKMVDIDRISHVKCNAR